MKKVLITLAVITLLFCGCSIKDVKSDGNSKYNEPLPEKFSSELHIVQYGIESIAELEYSKNSEATICYSAPAIANGMRISRSNEGTKIEFLGLKYNNIYNVLPNSNVLPVIDGASNALLSSENYKVRLTADTVVYEGTYDEVPFTLTRDKKTMTPILLTVDGYDLNITFSQFNINE